MKKFTKYALIIILILAAILRLYKLSSVPPSLNWDEASLAYNAYSILKTGHDEHGKFMPITNFAAFGDYKPPGYVYVAVPSIAVFGLGEFGVRFPSAFFGVLTVFLTYLISKKLFKNEVIALLSTFFLAISPWHLQFSRGAFEANLGLFFSTLGIWSFLKFSEKNQIFFHVSMLSFLAAVYTFTGQRLFVPFVLVFLFFYFRDQLIANIKSVVVGLVISLVLFWPLFKFSTFTIEGQLRFNEVTRFKDLEPIERSVHYRERDNYSFFSSIIHNRRLLYVREYLIGYFDAFNPSFLFTQGDINPRLSIREVGELYYFDLILILAGLYFLFDKKITHRFLLVGWLLLAPLGPATARETPHALRMVHILPAFQILSALGLYHLSLQFKLKNKFVTLWAIIIAFSLFYYLHMYYIHWPKNYSGAWQYGYKQAVEYVNENNSRYDKVIVTRKYGRPYIYFLLFNKFDSREYWNSAQIERDNFYFIDVLGFDKYIFTNDPISSDISGNNLYILDPGNVPKGMAIIKTIYNLGNEPVFVIAMKQ